MGERTEKVEPIFADFTGGQPWTGMSPDVKVYASGSTPPRKRRWRKRLPRKYRQK